MSAIAAQCLNLIFIWIFIGWSLAKFPFFVSNGNPIWLVPNDKINIRQKYSMNHWTIWKPTVLEYSLGAGPLPNVYFVLNINKKVFFRFLHQNDVRFIFTSSCLYLHYLCLFAYSGVQHILCCVCVHLVSCVPNVTSFSGLSIID